MTVEKNLKSHVKKPKTKKKNDIRKTYRSIPKKKLRIPEIELLTIEKMKSLKVYHSSYNDLIHIYANMIYEYERCLEQFEQEGKKYEVETGSGSTKKSGIVSAMEVLRKDIGTYSDRLQLNPRSSGGIVEEKKDRMSKFLSEYN